MNFRRTRAPGRWRIALAFIVLHVFFAVRTSLPQMVICHKAGGGSAVEFDTADGCCQCQECEHCRARRLAPRSGPAVPALEPCHCQHELILSDIGHSSLRLPDRHPFFDPASAPAEHGIEPILLPLRARLFIEAYSGRSSGPADSAFALLRC
jgi:hypothetical protein